MQPFGKRFRQAVGQCFDHDGRVIVIGALEPFGNFVFADAGSDGEAAYIILETAAPWCDELAERGVRTSLALGQMLPKRMQNSSRPVAQDISIKTENVDIRIR